VVSSRVVSSMENDSAVPFLAISGAIGCWLKLASGRHWYLVRPGKHVKFPVRTKKLDQGIIDTHSWTKLLRLTDRAYWGAPCEENIVQDGLLAMLKQEQVSKCGCPETTMEP